LFIAVAKVLIVRRVLQNLLALESTSSQPNY
jgi:hypothetical protein